MFHLFADVSFEASLPEFIQHLLPCTHACRAELEEQLQLAVILSNGLSLQACSQNLLPFGGFFCATDCGVGPQPTLAVTSAYWTCSGLRRLSAHGSHLAIYITPYIIRCQGQFFERAIHGEDVALCSGAVALAVALLGTH